VLPSMTRPSSAAGAGLVPKRPDKKAMLIPSSGGVQGCRGFRGKMANGLAPIKGSPCQERRSGTCQGLGLGLSTGSLRLRPPGGRSSGVERNLAKVEVEGSNPFARSSFLDDYGL
jgi:hypothetical protein